MKGNRRSGLRKTVLTAGAVGALILASAAVPALAAAPHEATTYHALDGYVMDREPADDPAYDWDDIFEGAEYTVPTPKTLPEGAISSDFTRDFRTDGATPPVYVNGDSSYFATGSKDTLDITPGWQCKKTNNATDKGDYVNAYGYAAVVKVGGVDHIVFFFGLEKDDDNGTNNIGIWLLQDGTVSCESLTGGNTAFTGHHMDGDLLAVVEYDSGGNVGTALGYTWQGGALVPEFSQAEAECSSSLDDSSRFCVITNADGTRETPWWSPQKGDKTYDAVLQQNVFVEGFLDITNIFDAGSEPCYASALANTRASTSTTAALYDFVEIEAPTCGPLIIKKYYDRDAQGDRDADDVAATGWTFKVVADGEDPAVPANVLYEVTTAGTEGQVTIPNVPFGAYDVYEVGQAGYYPTDPGNPGTPDYPVMKSITKTAGTQELEFGNACYVDKTFEISSVPTGVASVTVEYNAAPFGDAYTTLPLVQQAAPSTTYSATVADTLKQSDSIAWRWYINGDTAHKVMGASEVSPEVLGAYGYPTCAKTNTDQLDLVTLQGSKYKDVNTSGDYEPGTDLSGGAGWVFYLRGTDATAYDNGTAVQGPVTTNSSGVFEFTNVAPGTYRVFEVPVAGWVQTAPHTPYYREVTVALGAPSPIDVGDFLNHPLSRIDVDLTALASNPDGSGPATQAAYITCRQSMGSNEPDYDPDVNAFEGRDLPIATYECTIVIIDP